MGSGNYVNGVNPQILQWARDKAGYSIEDIAQKTNKDVELILEWENGTSVPTYNQLEDLAYRLYKRPLAIFFFPNPPKEEDISESFRTLSNVELTRITPSVRFLIRDAESLQITLGEINDNINPQANLIFRDIDIDLNEDVDKTAQEIRNYLGVSLEKQFSWNTSREALNEWRNAIEEKGIFIFKNAFHQDEISGFCLYDEKFPIIYLNNSNAINRQIFTVFHELCHLLLKSNAITKNTSDYLSHLRGNELKLEVFCNEFASRFLVPTEDFNARILYSEINEKTVNDFANLYHVSREVILRNILNRGLISNSAYEELALNWTNEFLRSKKGSSSGDYFNTQVAYFGENFIKLLFQKHYEGYLSLEQVAQNMNMKVQNVSKLEQRVLERQFR